MIEEFIDSVLIIDDSEEEVEDLKKVLEEKDIWVKFLLPNECKTKIKSRKLLFIDLHIDETAGDKLNAHISKIRKILKIIITKENTSYGLIVWTNHIGEVKTLKEKLQNDTEYLKPLFIIGISKLKYSKEGFVNLLSDIEDELRKNIAANFFINWSNLVQEGKDKTITSIFELVPDYKKQDKNLEFLLFKMAQNYTGIPFDKIDAYELYKDAYKSFSEMLHNEIINNLYEMDCSLFENINNVEFIFNESAVIKASGEYVIDDEKLNIIKIKKELDTIKNKIKIYNELKGETESLAGQKETIKDKIKKIKSYEKKLQELYSLVNTRMFLDNDISINKIFPGNIYKITDKDIPLSNKQNSKDIPIAIEMTPPCDFANSKNSKPKIIIGFLTAFSEGRIRQLKSESMYIETFPIKLNDFPDLSVMAFDFQIITIVNDGDLTNKEKFILIAKAKDKLFADILQKMSAYTARLGLSIIR